MLLSSIAAASATGLTAPQDDCLPRYCSFGPAAVMAAAVSALTKPPPLAYLAKLAV